MTQFFLTPRRPNGLVLGRQGPYFRQVEPKLVRAAALVIVVSLFAACASTPDRIVLNALETSKATADAAMRTLATGYAQGRTFDVATKTWAVTNPALVVVSDDTKAKAIGAYDKFAAVAKTTALALKAVGTQQQADALTKDLTAALSELLKTLQLLGVTP